MKKLMTLKEQCYEYSEDDLDLEPTEWHSANCLVKIFDVYAIEFAEWVIHNYPNKGTNHEDKLLYSKKPSPLGWSIELLLEIYKKEKGL
jgi:hypothetical protein